MMDWLASLQVIGQGMAVILLARLVYQIGHLTGVVEGLVTRISSLEAWRDSYLPKL